MNFCKNILSQKAQCAVRNYAFSQCGGTTFETPIFEFTDLKNFRFVGFAGWAGQTATYYLYFSSDGGKNYELYKSGAPSGWQGSAPSPLVFEFDKYGKKVNRIKITTSCTDSRVTSCCTLSWIGAGA